MSDPRFPGHDEWDALAVGWALSALHPDDEQRFADHLPGCDRCTATVREALYTAADLAYAVPDEAPPPALKSRLMAAVAAEPRSVPLEEEPEWPLGTPHPGTPGYGDDWFARPGREVAGPARPGWAGPADPPPTLPDRHRPTVLPAPAGPPDADPNGRSHQATPAPAGFGAGGRPDGPFFGGGRPGDERPTGPPEQIAGPRAGGRHAAPGGDDVVVPLDRHRAWRRRLTVGAAAAAALAVLAGLGAWNVQLRSDRDDLRQVAAERDRLQQVVAQRDAAISQLTRNGPATVAALTATGKPDPTRQATVVIRGNQAEVIVESLGATTGEERYWLWTLNCDTAQPSDLRPIRGFTVAQPEFSVRDIGSGQGLGTATCFAISQEIGTATPIAPRKVVAVGKPV